MNYKQGWINLYKPKNISSFKAINKIKKKFSIKKIGHAGTLDPLAEGVLPIALNNTTKLIPFINNNLKTYNFEITWGSQTSTDDSEGDILFKSNNFPEKKQIEKKIKKYIGYTDQVPPKVSAVKVNGKRAYKLVREKVSFNIFPKTVFVQNIKLIKHKRNTTIFNIECGKGFYIRSLARDLARDLETFGHISSLRREKVGNFIIESSILLDDLLKIGQRQLEINWVLPSISMLDDILAFEILDNKDIENLSFGRSIKIDKNILKDHDSIFDDQQQIFLSSKGDIISIGKLIGNLFKPNRILL